MAGTLPTAYLNGEFLPLEEARISPLDRGFLFGDAIYEVVPVYDGKPHLTDAHIARLKSSLAAIHITNPLPDQEWVALIHTLIERNGGGTLAIYIQISRGAETGRDHVWTEPVAPTLFAMATELNEIDYQQGAAAITLPDQRWGRCDIKATALLANVLARHEAAQAGAIDAILIRDGHVTEGAVSSVIIVENNCLVRRPSGSAVLPGTTTDHVVSIATAEGYACREEPITLERLIAADEVWLTGATKCIAPIIAIDGKTIGAGKPGSIWQAVNALYEADQHGR